MVNSRRYARRADELDDLERRFAARLAPVIRATIIDFLAEDRPPISRRTESTDEHHHLRMRRIKSAPARPMRSGER